MNKPIQSDTDIIGLLTRLQQQVTALDRKMDTLISKCSRPAGEARPAVRAAAEQPVYAHTPIEVRPRVEEHRPARQMHQATCADCKQECEIPFKPSGDRPVYCKECFSLRKAAGRSKAPVHVQPAEKPEVPTVVSPAPAAKAPAKEKKKRAAVKKPVVKKKTAPKKKTGRSS